MDDVQLETAAEIVAAARRSAGLDEAAAMRLALRETGAVRFRTD